MFLKLYHFRPAIFALSLYLLLTGAIFAYARCLESSRYLRGQSDAINQSEVKSTPGTQSLNCPHLYLKAYSIIQARIGDAAELGRRQGKDWVNAGYSGVRPKAFPSLLPPHLFLPPTTRPSIHIYQVNVVYRI